MAIFEIKTVLFDETQTITNANKVNYSNSTSSSRNNPSLPQTNPTGIAMMATRGSTSSNIQINANQPASRQVLATQPSRPESSRRSLPVAKPAETNRPASSAKTCLSQTRSAIQPPVPMFNDMKPASVSIAPTIASNNVSTNILSSNKQEQSSKNVIIPDEEMAFYQELERKELERLGALAKPKTSANSTISSSTTNIRLVTQTQVEIISDEEMAKLEELEQQMLTQMSSSRQTTPVNSHQPNATLHSRNALVSEKQTNQQQNLMHQKMNSFPPPKSQPAYGSMNQIPQVQIRRDVQTSHSSISNRPMTQPQRPNQNAQLVGDVSPPLWTLLTLIFYF